MVIFGDPTLRLERLSAKFKSRLTQRQASAQQLSFNFRLTERPVKAKTPHCIAALNTAMMELWEGGCRFLSTIRARYAGVHNGLTTERLG